MKNCVMTYIFYKLYNKQRSYLSALIQSMCKKYRGKHLLPPTLSSLYPDLHPYICPSFSKPCSVAGGGGTSSLVAHLMAGWLESQRGGATASGSLALPAQAPELRATATKGGPHPESACSAF